MADDPHDSILDRELFRIQIADLFADQIKLLEQLVNYGTNLLIRCYASSSKSVPDIVAIISFFKHAVTSLDAISILSREGATLACLPHLRSMFEIELYLKWIFQEDFENRATAYFVWNVRKKRYWLRCYLEGTPEYLANIDHMQGTPDEIMQTTQSQEDIQAAIEIEESRLNTPELSGVNYLFDEHMNNAGKDVDWFRPFGPTSIRDMAKRLGEEGMYKIFYSKYSEVTHGLSMDEQLHFNSEESSVVFDHIRSLNSLDQIFNMSASYSISLFKLLLQHYRPTELPAFSKKYSEEWRAAYLSIPEVKKEGATFKITRKNN